MKTTLKTIRDYYFNLEQNSSAVVCYMERPLSEHIQVFNAIFEHSIMEIEKPESPQQFQQLTAHFTDFLNEAFYDKAWACHDIHFHNNFRHYLACPMTCLSEIVETLDRIIQERFQN